MTPTTGPAATEAERATASATATEVTDTDTHADHLGYAHSKNGRPISWVAVVLMTLSFAVGGLALVLWNWPLFWGSAGVFLASALLALAGGIMRDVH